MGARLIDDEAWDRSKKEAAENGPSCSVAVVVGLGAIAAAVAGGNVIIDSARANTPDTKIAFTCEGAEDYTVLPNDTMTNVLDEHVKGVDDSNVTRITEGFSIEGRNYDGYVEIPVGIIGARSLNLALGEVISIPESCEPAN